jgi:hypothetical protein
VGPVRHDLKIKDNFSDLERLIMGSGVMLWIIETAALRSVLF